MIYGFTAAVFLGMAILFMGIAVEWRIAWAWIFAALNGLLFGLNLTRYFANEDKRRD